MSKGSKNSTQKPGAKKPASLSKPAPGNEKEKKKVVPSPIHLPKGEKTVEVKGLVNMHCADGSQLVEGEVSLLSEAEVKRLESDVRGKMLERVK